MRLLTFDQRQKLSFKIRQRLCYFESEVEQILDVVDDWYSEISSPKKDEFSPIGPDITKDEKIEMRASRLAVFNIMKDGRWRTLEDIQACGIKSPPQSIAIYLRSFRESRYGGYIVNRKKLHDRRLFSYQVLPPL